MSSEDKYESIYASRYCKNSPLIKIFSETNKARLWRQLWIWLAEAEKELGLKQVTQDAIDEMKVNKDNFNEHIWKRLRDEERRVKHDVMAHNHIFGQVFPGNVELIGFLSSVLKPPVLSIWAQPLASFKIMPI